MTGPKSKLNPTEIAASLRDVTVTYDGYQSRALSRVTVAFRRGAVTAILGEKGAGKSTLLKILAGRVGATEGAVKVFGRSPRGGMKARIGYLPGKADENHPPGFMDRLLGIKKEMSTSARGAALAQAVLGNRDLLVLDDPFADLAPAEISEAKTLIRDLAARGKTVVISSDALMEVTDICHQFVVMHEGRVQAEGTLAELLASPDAIRFLPAVLPKDIVERVLNVLRREILPATASAGAGLSTQSPEKTAFSAKPGEIAAEPLLKLNRSGPEDSIDHEKLEGLLKPPSDPQK